MGNVVTLAGAVTPRATLRNGLTAAIAELIDLLDRIDGDPDLEDNGDTEANGDEDDGNFAEDEPCLSFLYLASGPGCRVADPDKGVEDGAFDGEEDCCDAHDDGCGPVAIHGRVVWGSEHDETGQ